LEEEAAAFTGLLAVFLAAGLAAFFFVAMWW
jgi:hypothetical protein